MVGAVHDRDIPLVQAIVLVIAGTYVVLNMGTDLLVMMLDPRLRSMRG
jgi:peptide/nickel transport system permease protein